MSSKPRVLSCDGYSRSPEDDKHLNDMVRATFTSPSGRETLTYLKAITIHAVCGPEISDAGLRHREGMRHLVAIIEQRLNAK